LEPLKGVLVLDKDSLETNVSPNFRIWGQITLTFRYGREDEEVLGLRFCNEAILALKQLWPPISSHPDSPDEGPDELTPLQVKEFENPRRFVSLFLKLPPSRPYVLDSQIVLLERISSSTSSPSINSLAFTLCAGPVGLGSFPPPPSVLLAPAKPYKGSPIGTIYDLRIYACKLCMHI